MLSSPPSVRELQMRLTRLERQALRRAMRADLLTWCREALRPVKQTPARHHRLLIRELEAVDRGETRRLLFTLPPGSAKSTYGSDLFPAWYLRKPHRNIICASNTGDMAKTFSRRVRGRAREHGAALGYGLEREAEELWETDTGGIYRAAGAGATITGSRADLIVIDDPIKGREQADSPEQREKIWNWYQDDVQTRLKPGGSIILIQTRWHEDDLAGRILAHEGDAWRVVSIPMQSEGPGDPLGRPAGEYLWTGDGYGYGEDIAERRTRMLPRTWSSLYQQRPAPEDGSFFLRDWMREGTPPPRDQMQCYGASDYAVTENGGDFTVHVVVGLDNLGRLWLLDLWRGQRAADAWVEAFCDLVLKWRPLGWAEEHGQIKAALGPYINSRQRARSAFVARTSFPTRGDKATRAQSIRGRMALDGLWLAPHALFRADLERELLSFPTGVHDDQVDALGLAGQLLDTMAPGAGPRKPDKPRDSWARAFAGGDDDGVDGWRVA